MAVKRAPDGKLVPGTAKIPGSGLQKDSPLSVFRRALRGKPLPGDLDRMIEAFEIPEDAAAELRRVENGMEAMVQLCLHRAYSGSWEAWQQIMDRVAPKPKAVELSGPGGGPVQSVGVQAQVSSSDAARQYQLLLAGEDVVDAEFEDEPPDPMDDELLQ